MMSSIWLYIKDSFILTVPIIAYCLLNLIISIRLYLFPIYKSLKNEVILITGAGNGLGRYLCVEFSKYCPSILALDIDEKGLHETAELVSTVTGCSIKTYTCDLKDKQAVDKITELIIQQYGGITVLVNNAGILKGGPFLKGTMEDFEDMLKVNTLAHYQLIKAFLPSMLGSGDNWQFSEQHRKTPHGHIVCISSVSAVMPFRGLPLYGSSKAAALSLMESLELELASVGITDQICITKVLPYLINTSLIGGIIGSRSNIFPINDTVWCAKRIVEGVLKNERVIYIGSCMRFFAILKLLSPMYAYRYVNKVMSASVIYAKKPCNN
uniref:Uncharacterized protein n=1 Tax=Trichobilharzia regenti TaxID=157069 RepID=A0AA85KE75_TRIRE|nr:unnamed protein product [Trichobilharzia regenti]